MTPTTVIGPVWWIRTTVSSLEWNVVYCWLHPWQDDLYTCANHYTKTGNLVPLLGLEPRELFLLREATLPICPQGHFKTWSPMQESNLRSLVPNQEWFHFTNRSYKLERPTGIEPVSRLWQSLILPFNYGRICLVDVSRFELLTCRVWSECTTAVLYIQCSQLAGLDTCT